MNQREAMKMPSAETIREGRAAMAERCYTCALENTPETVKVVYIRSALTGRAKYHSGELHAPRPKTRKALYIFLHECAHFALHINSKKPVHVKEMEAEQWAHEKMRAHGIPVPRVMTVRAKEYVEHKIRKAERRGAKHIDAAARKFSER